MLTELPAAGPRFHGGKFGGSGATHFVNPSAKDLGHRVLALAPRLGLEPEHLVALDLNKHSQPDVDATGWIGAKGCHVMLRANEAEIFRRSGVYGLDRFHRAVQLVNQARITKGEKGVSVVRLGDKGWMPSRMDMNQKIDRALKKPGKDWERLF